MRLGVYHSKFPDNERVELWRKQLSDAPFPLILGVRSSLFLPFQNLGLVIIDEEHESSYKQQDPAPRYHARDTAILMAHQAGAKVLLGTATPSVETYAHAQEGKYGYVAMNQRFGEVAMPEIVVEDVAELRRKRLMPTLLSTTTRRDRSRSPTRTTSHRVSQSSWLQSGAPMPQLWMVATLHTLRCATDPPFENEQNGVSLLWYSL